MKISVVVVMAMLLLACRVSAGNQAGVKISGSVEVIAVVAVTQGGVSTGDNKSYVTVHDGVTTIVGDGLVWRVNTPNVKITVHSDGGLGSNNLSLSVYAVNVKGGQSSGRVTLGSVEQEVVSNITFGTGSCYLEYQVVGSPNGTEIVTYTISAK